MIIRNSIRASTMKKNIYFTGTWRDFFAEYELTSLDDFFKRYKRDHEGPETVSKKSKADVHTLTLGTESDEKVFYLKRFHFPGYKNILRAWSIYGKPITYGRLEYENANFLLSNGIGAYKPVCFGEDTVWGLEAKSFIVTEKLQVTPLESFVVRKWNTLARKEQENIFISLAKTVRRVHNLNISMPHMFVKHIFIDESTLGKQCRFSFIDLEKMAMNVKDPRRKARDLGRLYYSMAKEYFDEDIKHLFIETYMKDCPGRNDKFKRIILASAEKMANRRKLLEYIG